MADDGFSGWERWSCPACGVKTIRALTYWEASADFGGDDNDQWHNPQWRLHCVNGHEVAHEPLSLHDPMVAR